MADVNPIQVAFEREDYVQKDPKSVCEISGGKDMVV